MFDNEFVNRGLAVLEAARGLDSWRRPEGSLPLGRRVLDYPDCANLVKFEIKKNVHLSRAWVKERKS